VFQEVFVFGFLFVVVVVFVRMAPNPQNKVSRFLLVADLEMSKPNVCILHRNFR
jgi:hypothetical protein